MTSLTIIYSISSQKGQYPMMDLWMLGEEVDTVGDNSDEMFQEPLKDQKAIFIIL